MMKTKVLLIDDEKGFAEALGKRLGRRGFAIRSVNSGPEALDAVTEEAFDVILLDIKMSGMDGLKTLGEIKRRHPLVEIVMLTGHINTDMVISSLAMGAYDYLMKPACLEELVLKIEDAAQRKQRNLEQGAP